MLKLLRALVAEWRDTDLLCAEANDYKTCADELEKILNATDTESAASVEGTPDTHSGRGTYYPDRKVVGS